MEVDVGALASEFPNDNPALHRGVVWVCQHPTGPAVAEVPAPPVEPRVMVEAMALVVEEIAAREAQLAHTSAPAPEVVQGSTERADLFAVTAPMEAIEVVEPFDDDASFELASLLEAAIADATSRPSGILAIAPRAPIPESFEIEALEAGEQVVARELEPSGEPMTEGSVPPPSASEPAAAEREGAAPLAAIPAPLESAVVVAAAANDVAPDAGPETSSEAAEPFTMLLSALADVATAAGSAHVAAVLPGLLVHGRLDQPLPDEARRALVEARILDGDAVTEAFGRTTRAWRAILDGTSEDFDATGGAMLDEWASDLLARLLGAPSIAQSLRRDLRSKGVAAFGLAA